MRRASSTVTITLTVPDDLYEQMKHLTDGSEEAIKRLMVRILEQEYGSKHENQTASTARDERTRQLRRAMGDRASAVDPEEYLRRVGIEPMTDEEMREVLATIPVLDPPLSQTVIEEREDRL